MKASTTSKVKTKREHGCIFKVHNAVPAQSPWAGGKPIYG